MLTKPQLKKLEKRLLESRDKIRKELERFAKKSKQIKGDYKAKFPQIGYHQDENALEVATYESDLALEHDLELNLSQIERALDKIKQAKYGVCERCRSEVGFKRLQAFPEAKFCIKCQRKIGK